MKIFKEKWSSFCGIIFGPSSAIFIVLTIASLIFAYVYKEDTLFSTLLAIMGSVFGGISGTFIKDDYDKLVGKNTLEKKGRSALRNLETINTQLINIREWIVTFNKNLQKENRGALEEVDRHISTVQLNINSGLADWIDIVPELKENVQQEAQMEKKYKEVIQSYVTELLEKKKELVSSKDEKITTELKKKISDLEKQIKNFQKESSRVTGGGGFATIKASSLGTYLPNNAVIGYNYNKLTCSKCGRQIEPPLFPSVWSNGLIQYCDECKKDLNISD